MKDFLKRALYSMFLLFAPAVFSLPAMAEESVVSPESVRKSGVFFNELSVGSGYVQGDLKSNPEDLVVYPAFVRIGFNINSLVGISGGRSTLQFALEPFVNPVVEPEIGLEAGLGIGLRYFHELSGPVSLFFEASVAPMFLSIDTAEQGKAGFNFLDQMGAGIQCRLSDRAAVFGGYRRRHISHAGLADRSNNGINSNAIVAGFSLLY
ncbi:MAG: acyloxyacyl hydrolase [Desulfobulbaceae bacterium]|nr:acyloxyacyl hydrolase [Desulfobulbaceae bacterium]